MKLISIFEAELILRGKEYMKKCIMMSCLLYSTFIELFLALSVITADTSLFCFNFKGEIIIVQLERGPSGLGMRLTSHNDFGDKSGAFIANIIPGGTAAKTGKLRSGDKVISVSVHLSEFSVYGMRSGIESTRSGVEQNLV